MTTYIVDDKSAACDSMWSYRNGDKCTDCPINKYLYISEPMQGFDIEPCLIVYSGDYEQLVLHQALRLEIINLEQYKVVMENYQKIGRRSLSYVEISLPDWNFDKFNTRHDLGLLFEGTGGHHAFMHYRDNYCVKRAVEYAIEQDPRSDYEINHMSMTLVKDMDNLKVSNFAPLDEDMYNQIYSHTEQLHMALQTQEAGIVMTELKYAGCSTSPSVEAQSFSTAQLIDVEKKRLEKKAKSISMQHSIIILNKKKITKKVIQPKTFNLG